MNIRRFLIVTIVAFVLFMILVLVLMFSGAKKKGSETAPTPAPTGAYYPKTTPEVSKVLIPTVVISLPPTEKVIINKVVVNNFFPKATKINDYGDYSLAKNEEYKILYEAQFNLFLISIVSSPFEEIKKRAENELIMILGVNRTDACKLNVSVTTPMFANPNEAGVSYKLSFCE